MNATGGIVPRGANMEIVMKTTIVISDGDWCFNAEIDLSGGAPDAAEALGELVADFTAALAGTDLTIEIKE